VLFRLVHHVGDVLVRVVPEEVVKGAEEERFRDGFAAGGFFFHQVPGEGVHQAGLSRGVAPDTPPHLRVEDLPRLPGVLKQKVLGLLPGEVGDGDLLGDVEGARGALEDPRDVRHAHQNDAPRR
jgi:hypothetical protein